MIIGTIALIGSGAEATGILGGMVGLISRTDRLTGIVI